MVMMMMISVFLLLCCDKLSVLRPIYNKHNSHPPNTSYAFQPQDSSHVCCCLEGREVTFLFSCLLTCNPESHSTVKLSSWHLYISAAGECLRTGTRPITSEDPLKFKVGGGGGGDWRFLCVYVQSVVRTIGQNKKSPLLVSQNSPTSPQLIMEAGEENNASMKRQRTPLSDSEDNVFSPSDMNDGQKRRRLDAAGQENRSPKPSSSGRLAELGIKADTPMVPSVQSRVHQLTHRREEAPTAPRCFSDPGADSPAANVLDKGFREHLLGEGEFSQRMGRFKVPVLQTGLTPSPSSLCSRTRSNLVSDIHQKLQVTTTPSSKQASRIRQERDQEISQLHFQPISENAWLKRSSSDPLLAQQDEDEAEKKDGSFSEAPTSAAENPSANTTGKTLMMLKGFPQ
ncbi:unnamed protein product [Pleuronectes platessa]|uniref:Uncharacterized protein n=1 Tax=Pleuronectes platessa TaxID=8262 RepID=A0A9N7W289_PLEPL|nr:unnamed protein product [Pleuronectes platessa]